MNNVTIRFYDNCNLGDDLFVVILTDRYMDYFLCTSANKTRSIEPIDNLKVSSIGRLAQFIDRVIGKLFKKRYPTLRRLINRSDLLVYVGGSIFMETHGPGPWEVERKFYQSVTVPYYILGSNFGPYESSEFIDIARDIVAGAKDVCFRDNASYEMFKDVPTVRKATDIAFTLDTSSYMSEKQDKTVVFSVIDAYKKFDDATAARYDEEIVNLAKKFVGEGYGVTLMSFCKYENDENAIRRILGLMGDEMKSEIGTYMYTGDLDEALSVLAKSEGIVASRFHASILGLLFGKKVLPIVYSDKTINILEDMSFKGPVVDIRKINKFDGNSFDLSTLEVNDVRDQIELAEKQFQELDKVLTKRE